MFIGEFSDRRREGSGAGISVGLIYGLLPEEDLPLPLTLDTVNLLLWVEAKDRKHTK